MIFVGLDDTDTLATPGTNQLARHIAAALPDACHAWAIVRHQLLLDPRIPYTSQNGSASMAIGIEPGGDRDLLLATLRDLIREWYVPGSDPGLCVADAVPGEIVDFARRCQREPVRQQEARSLAADNGVLLEGFGGTEDGVIGALAAVGLLAAGDDGRVVHLAGWTWPDHFSGAQPVEAIRARGVEVVLDAGTGTPVHRGIVDVGKHLRPACRGGRILLYVEPAGDPGRWRALKLT